MREKWIANTNEGILCDQIVTLSRSMKWMSGLEQKVNTHERKWYGSEIRIVLGQAREYAPKARMRSTSVQYADCS